MYEPFHAIQIRRDTSARLSRTVEWRDSHWLFKAFCADACQDERHPLWRVLVAHLSPFHSRLPTSLWMRKPNYEELFFHSYLLAAEINSRLLRRKIMCVWSPLSTTCSISDVSETVNKISQTSCIEAVFGRKRAIQYVSAGLPVPNWLPFFGGNSHFIQFLGGRRGYPKMSRLKWFFD